MAYYREHSLPHRMWQGKNNLQPMSTAIFKLKKELPIMEEVFKKTPKVTTNVPNAKPVQQKLKDLLKPENYHIYTIGDSYVIKAKHSLGESEELSFVVYRNFLMSDFVQTSEQLTEAITNYFSFYNDESHPKQQEALEELLAKQQALKSMITSLKGYVQKELF